jgi:hypothetical protein
MFTCRFQPAAKFHKKIKAASKVHQSAHHAPHSKGSRNEILTDD